MSEKKPSNLGTLEPLIDRGTRECPFVLRGLWFVVCGLWFVVCHATDYFSTFLTESALDDVEPSVRHASYSSPSIHVTPMCSSQCCKSALR